MVQINFGQREVSCKIVFYGPGMSGKTTNLEVIHQKAPKQAVGEMVSIATETDRTLYFDFMPMDLGQVAGMHTKFMLYTVPGQIYYNATRKLVLQGVDGIIFVADSDPNKMSENLESLQNLRDNLAEMGLALEDIPLVLQYNKRDLPGAMPVPDMNAQMNPMGVPTYEACARDGRGVFATLKEVSRLVIERLNREHAPAANRRRTANSLTPPNAGNAMPATPGPMPAAPARPTPPPLPPRPPAPPTAPMRSAATTTPQGVPLARGGGSGGHAIPLARPAPPALPRAPTAPARSAPAAPPRPAPPSKPAPPAEDLSPREKHLAKAKPAPLAQRQGGKVNLGNTDPNLKRYQEQQKSGGPLRVIGWLVLGLGVALVLLVVLAFISKEVAALLPIEWQQRIDAFKNPPLPVAAPTPPPGAGVAVPTAAAPVSATPHTTAPAVAKPAPKAPVSVTIEPAPTPVVESDFVVPAPLEVPESAPALAPAPAAEGAHGQ